MKFKRIFTEAFSESIPDWLKQYVLHHPSSGKFSKYADAAYSRFAYRRDKGRDKYGSTAIDAIRGQNPQNSKIDLFRANFVVDDVPKLENPILWDPSKMCFIHLVSDNDETVWIPGITSESEKFIRDNGSTVALSPKYLNNKILREAGKDFCYLDMTDPNTFTNDMEVSRKARKAGMETRMPSKNNPKFYSALTWGQIDKSGYWKVPSVKKYADKLREMKVKKLPERLLNIREKLVQLKKDIFEFTEIYSDTNINSTDELEIHEYAISAYHKLLDAIKTLKNVTNKIDSLENMGKNEYRYGRTIDEIMNYLNYEDETIEKIYSLLNRHLPKAVDWDVPYIDVEDDFE